MVRRIIIALAIGCVLVAVGLLYGHSSVDSSFRGAPLAFLQKGMTLSFESRYRVDFKALIFDVLFFSVPVFVFLQAFRIRNTAGRRTGAS